MKTIILAALATLAMTAAASADGVYRGDYPMNGNAWYTVKCDAQGHCKVVAPDLSTFGGSAGGGF